jgi:lysophospholipase L1-like esterase
MSLFVVCTAFSLLEAGWYFFHIESDNNNRTLASRRWYEKHWKPLNTFGIRDLEHQGRDYRDKKVLFVAGDSFTAGQGIEDPGERYPDLLRQRLGDDWAVVIVAKCGWNTVNELGAIQGVARNLGVQPNAVILTYFVNDIMELSYLKGRKKPFPLPPKLDDPYPAFVGWLKDRSYFFNDLYWRLLRSRAMEAHTADHWDILEQAYADEELWSKHRADLLGVVDWCADYGAPLVVMIFPHLARIESTAGMSAQVADFFRDFSVTVIDLGVLLKDRDPRELTVSALDSHPNTALHREIAQMLYEAIKRLGL